MATGTITKKSTPRPRAAKSPWDRYPLEALGASYFAEQAYCEKRVDLWLKDPGNLVSIPKQIEGKVPGAVFQQELADVGTQFHQAASDKAAPISRSDLKADLRAGKSVILVESPFSASYRKLPLAGVPDAVCFDGRNAACVIEYKVTDSNQLQTSHRVQLLLYGYLLEQESFGVGDLLLICALVPRAHGAWAESLNDTEAEGLVSIIRSTSEQLVASEPSHRNWHQGNVRVSDGVTVWLRVFRYERSVAERELQFFSDFWLGRRPAKPTSKPGKCTVCLYNACSLCPDALVPYSGPIISKGNLTTASTPTRAKSRARE
jgi:hypothetical protein